MPKVIQSTPRADGFRMPGEFEPHQGTWILWPVRPDNWRYGANPAQQTFVKVAEAISQFEPVTVGVSAGQFNNARQMLPPQVRVVEMSNNDSWIRDCGPTFVTNGQVVRAIVVLRDGGAGSPELARELQDHVKQRTAPYKYPRIVEFDDALPKTPSGKIKRAELRD